MRDLLSDLVEKIPNPHKELWKNYRMGKTTADALHKTLREKVLNRLRSLKYQKYPPKPTKETDISMECWGRACVHIDCENAGNKHWLRTLLKDLEKGKLEGLGKKEEIQMLLSAYPKPKKAKKSEV